MEFRNLIKSLGKNRTVLISSHILAEISQICDKVIIIKDGKVALDNWHPKTNVVDTEGKKTLTVHLMVLGSREEIESMIRSVRGMLSIEFQRHLQYRENSENLVCEFKVIGDTGYTFREELTDKLIGNGFKLLELRAEGTTLEDVYIKAITSD